MKLLDEVMSIIFVISVIVFSGSMVYSFGKFMQAREVTDRCKTTGMYLTEGYAITCRVLTNEGYAPMIEQQKGK